MERCFTARELVITTSRPQWNAAFDYDDVTFLCQMGTHPPLPQKGAEPPKFSAHVYCGQTAGWIKILTGTEVGLATLC